MTEDITMNIRNDYKGAFRNPSNIRKPVTYLRKTLHLRYLTRF